MTTKWQPDHKNSMKCSFLYTWSSQFLYVVWARVRGRRLARGVLHSRNVVDDFRNLFGNVQKFGNNIEIWKLEIRSKPKFDWFAAPAILCAIEIRKN